MQSGTATALITILVATTATVLLMIGRIPGARWWRGLRDGRDRELSEDALKHMHACAERGAVATLESLAGALRRSPVWVIQLVERLEGRGWIRSSLQGLVLTDRGEKLALAVIRAHRLWERYLADEARMPLTDIHAEADRREHSVSPGALDAFEASLGFPSTDPHGDPIPTARGGVQQVPGVPVTDWPVDCPGRIVHLEDEPPATFARIDGAGFRLGQTIRVVEADVHRVVIDLGGETRILAPVVASNICVVATDSTPDHQGTMRLSDLKSGGRGIVRKLDASLRGLTRRRLLDLGLTTGTPILVEMTGVARDPTAYRVRGSLIALRSDQASHVWVDAANDGEVNRG